MLCFVLLIYEAIYGIIETKRNYVLYSLIIVNTIFFFIRIAFESFLPRYMVFRSRSSIPGIKEDGTVKETYTS